MRSFPKAALLFCGLVGSVVHAAPASAPATDPAVELGAAYEIDGATVTPADAPFDDVGLAAFDGELGEGIAVAHRTLPLPSYAEVTALDSGRTILVRIERRGPLTGPAFVALSAGAFAQIGADPAEPFGVRVRRVSPQEYERSLLRTGQRAPARLAAPKPLLEVLRRKLAEKSLATKPIARPTPSRGARVDLPPSAQPLPAKALPAKPAPPKAVAASPKLPPVKAPVAMPSVAFAFQVAAFANRASADAIAKKVAGTVSAAGRLWRVRIGPFATRTQADAAQAKVRKAGYNDAQVVTSPAAAGK